MITRVKWRNHAVLGDLELDFTKANGTPYNTIVLAGENGTGKTSILETLSTFLNLGSFEPFDSIFYEVKGAPFSCVYSRDLDSSLGFHIRNNLTTNSVTAARENKHSNFNAIKVNAEDIRHYGCAYTKARSGFSTKKVTSTTTSQLDSEMYSDDATDDYTSIKQLLINLRAQDTEEWTQLTEAGDETTYAEFSSRSKLQRFRLAFNNFFDGLTFDSVNTSTNDGIKIVFKKHGNAIDIDNLSTGEKQIVFRGAYLLKNIRSLDGGIVLIDEPELSMHPKWQQKVLEFYRNLFNVDGKQTVQMIIATHSEYVVKSALEDSDNVLVIALTDDNGRINPNRITAPGVLPCITAAETNYLAFDIVSNDYHIELYGWLQTKYQKFTVQACDNLIAADTRYYNPALHGRPSSYTNPKANQPTNYKTLPTYIRNQIDHPNPMPQFTEQELRTSIELLRQLCK